MQNATAGRFTNENVFIDYSELAAVHNNYNGFNLCDRQRDCIDNSLLLSLMAS